MCLYFFVYYLQIYFRDFWLRVMEIWIFLHTGITPLKLALKVVILLLL